MNTSIYASFTSPEMAERAAGALLDHGLKPENIDVIFPQGYRLLATEAYDERRQIHDVAEKGITTTTLGDAASGAATGAGVGFATGALAALAAVFVPGIGLVLGGGALAAAIAGTAGATAAGAIAGGVTGFLKDQGVPDQAVEEVTNTIRVGGAVLIVTPDEDSGAPEDLERILAKYQGVPRAFRPANSAALRG